MKEFINYQNAYDAFLEILMGCLDDDDKCTYESHAEEYAHYAAVDAVESMREYVHFKDTKMDGNFANIREDWDYYPDFVRSNVKPFGTFDDMLKGMDNDTFTDEQVAKVQEWCLDWYFTAFGTFGLTYNFQSLIGDLKYEEELENEE